MPWIATQKCHKHVIQPTKPCSYCLLSPLLCFMFELINVTGSLLSKCLHHHKSQRHWSESNWAEKLLPIITNDRQVSTKNMKIDLRVRCHLSLVAVQSVTYVKCQTPKIVKSAQPVKNVPMNIRLQLHSLPIICLYAF